MIPGLDEIPQAVKLRAIQLSARFFTLALVALATYLGADAANTKKITAAAEVVGSTLGIVAMASLDQYLHKLQDQEKIKAPVGCLYPPTAAASARASALLRLSAEGSKGSPATPTGPGCSCPKQPSA